MSKNSWYFVLPILAFVISTAIYLSFTNSFHHLGIEANRLEATLNLYPSLPKESILFLGESQVREDIDCHKIDQINNSPSCFNLGLAGILPLQLALQKELVIKAEPKTVVIGVSAVFFDETSNKNDDLFMVLSQNSETSSTASTDYVGGLLTEKEQNLLTMNFYQRAVYKRKFIMPFVLSFLKSIFSENTSTDNLQAIYDFKNPHFFTTRQSLEELNQKINDPQFKTIFEIEKSPLRERKAFVYLIHELRKAGIKVVILKMPLHPLVLQNVPAPSQAAFDSFISKTAETWKIEVLDYEDKYAAEDFTDLTHLTEKGEEKFTTDLIGGEHHFTQ